MSIQFNDRTVHGIRLGAGTAARTIANRLDSLEPLRDVNAALETLATAREIAARKAVAAQETKSIVDQLRTQSRKRRITMKGN